MAGVMSHPTLSSSPRPGRHLRLDRVRWLAAALGTLSVAGLALACFLLRGTASPPPASRPTGAHVGKPAEAAVRPFYQTLAR